MPLVLTRRPGETIRIGDDISVTISAISGNQVRLAITAPRDITIDREEIYQSKLDEALDIAERRQLDEAGRGHLKRP